MRVINSTLIHKFGMTIYIALFLGSVAFGQQLGDLELMQRNNDEKLRAYAWKSRTEIAKGGETKIVRLDHVRYAADGTIQTTQLSVTAPELPTGGLRGLIAKRKKEEFGKLVKDLGNLAQSYGKLSPEKLRSFMQTALIRPENSPHGKLVRIDGSDVRQPGDSMTVWVDPASRQQRKVEVKTSYEGKAVRIISEFKQLPGGPSYVSRAVIQYPEEELTITTDNFEHVRGEAVGGVVRP